MKIRCGRNLRLGITLVDVMMAMFVLGVMASGVIGSFRYGLFVMQLVRENQRATQVMLEKIETIRLCNWAQVTSNGFIPPTFTDVYDPQGTNAATRGCVYSGRIIGPTNMDFTSSYSTNMRKLTIQVQWTTRTIPHTRSVTTYFAKDGLQNYVF
jgi:type II secretory pathway pseudopilin PulG